MSREAPNLLPIGTHVLVTLHSITETSVVPGTVVAHGRRCNIIQTAAHGRVVVNTADLRIEPGTGEQSA
ncbi:hypothetical protein GCM10011584_34420 [Nocardioides phosphati]|uniref:Ferrous iron transport protein A n=1 Tax=Nocardioides phosphati TaxID=1867775 RepID=A0ABQ2NFC1_9ACTN|nr:hypothetical protein [Nocardioides phosphati]GGO94118.1 hypothetical protein GCM10011584_34420 [Nocardioides phosphati]